MDCLLGLIRANVVPSAIDEMNRIDLTLSIIVLANLCEDAFDGVCRVKSQSFRLLMLEPTKFFLKEWRVVSTLQDAENGRKGWVTSRRCLKLDCLQRGSILVDHVQLTCHGPLKVYLSRTHLLAPHWQAFKPELGFQLACIKELGKFVFLALEQALHVLDELFRFSLGRYQVVIPMLSIGNQEVL